MHANKFWWTKAYIWQVLLWLRPILGWHKHQRCTVANYHDYDHLLYVLLLQPYKLIIYTFTHLDNLFYNNYNHEYIHLYSWCFKNNLKSFFHKLLRNFSAFFALLTLFPSWPRMPLWYVVWMCEKYLLTKGHVGSRGGTHSKINYKTLNETPDARSHSFSKINWACAVTLIPFVGFGKCVFGRQLYTNIFGKCYWLFNIFRLKVCMVRQCWKWGGW